MMQLRGFPFLLAPLLLAGCEPGLGLGIGTRCEAEKQDVRRQHGIPDDVQEGIRSEIWIYNPPARITFTFSWDQEGENCTVRRSSFAELPAPL